MKILNCVLPIFVNQLLWDFVAFNVLETRLLGASNLKPHLKSYF